MTLPASVQEIAEVIGEESAAHLIKNLPTYKEVRRGRVSERALLYVPKKLHEGHILVKILGWDCATKLVKGFGGEMLKPANADAVLRWERDIKIQELIGAGMTKEGAARVFGLSARTIANITRARKRAGGGIARSQRQWGRGLTFTYLQGARVDHNSTTIDAAVAAAGSISLRTRARGATGWRRFWHASGAAM